MLKISLLSLNLALMMTLSGCSGGDSSDGASPEIETFAFDLSLGSKFVPDSDAASTWTRSDDNENPPQWVLDVEQGKVNPDKATCDRQNDADFVNSVEKTLDPDFLRLGKFSGTRVSHSYSATNGRISRNSVQSETTLTNAAAGEFQTASTFGDFKLKGYRGPIFKNGQKTISLPISKYKMKREQIEQSKFVYYFPETTNEKEQTEFSEKVKDLFAPEFLNILGPNPEDNCVTKEAATKRKLIKVQKGTYTLASGKRLNAVAIQRTELRTRECDGGKKIIEQEVESARVRSTEVVGESLYDYCAGELLMSITVYRNKAKEVETYSRSETLEATVRK